MKKAAEQGLVDAQVYLGCVYGRDDGVSVDKVKAFTLLESAAEQGSALAQDSLGVFYLKGVEGVSIKYQEGYQWMKLAAKSGYPDAVKFMESRRE